MRHRVKAGAVLAALLALGACGGAVAPDGPLNDRASAPSAPDASGGGAPPRSAAEDGERVCSAPEFSLADLSRFGACSGEPLGRAATREDAESLAGRIAHEALHIRDALAEGESGLTRVTSDDPLRFAGVEDRGFLVGAARREGGSAGAWCARAGFRCFAGGHGGWGRSALDGEATLHASEHGDPIRVRGALSLVEAGAFEGTPVMEVDLVVAVTADDAPVLRGRVGPFELPASP